MPIILIFVIIIKLVNWKQIAQEHPVRRNYVGITKVLHQLKS